MSTFWADAYSCSPSGTPRLDHHHSPNSYFPVPAGTNRAWIFATVASLIIPAARNFFGHRQLLFVVSDKPRCSLEQTGQLAYGLRSRRFFPLPDNVKLIALMIVGLLCTGATYAQEPSITPGSAQWREIFDPPYTRPTEVPTDSPLRKTLFDLLRPSIERIAKRSVQFQGRLRVYKNWALFVGSAVDKEERYVGMPPMDNSDTVGLWLHTATGWRLVDSHGGHSDAFYLIWTEQYGAPEALINH